MPTLISIQAGLPKRYTREGSDKAFLSGIAKNTVTGPIRLNAENLEGDMQADLENHGGPFRAVLSYAESHYDSWRDELDRPDFPYGAFGENFTISDLTEQTVCLGDTYEIGPEVIVQVSQPRLPCWKLARRWGIKDLADRVHKSNRGGWYSRVLAEGIVEVGMPVNLIERQHPNLTIAHVVNLIYRRTIELDACRTLMNLSALTPHWRMIFSGMVAEQFEAMD